MALYTISYSLYGSKTRAAPIAVVTAETPKQAILNYLGDNRRGNLKADSVQFLSPESAQDRSIQHVVYVISNKTHDMSMFADRVVDMIKGEF